MPRKEFRYLPLEQKSGIYYYAVDDSEKKYILGFVTSDKLRIFAENSKTNLQTSLEGYIPLPRLIIVKDLTTSSIKKALDEMNKNGTLERILKE